MSAHGLTKKELLNIIKQLLPYLQQSCDQAKENGQLDSYFKQEQLLKMCDKLFM